MEQEHTYSEQPLKTQGDKLSAALGETPESQPKDSQAESAEAPLKAHGDKLQHSVDEALGDGGAR